jgi:UDP-N-acetylmuramyl pentapeptide phosphotransferase/UDP-N-acetylglucosamine-1-phosphate transferase
VIAAALLLGACFAVGVPACRRALRFAEERQIIDHPNWRSSHSRPTPRGGGLGILAVVVPASVVAWLVVPDVGMVPAALAALLGGAVVLATLGFRDDRSELSPRVKMPLQAAVAGLSIVAVGAIGVVELPGAELRLGVLAVPLTLVWLVGFSNAFNFMDGIDGIAGLFAVVSGLFLSAAAWMCGTRDVAVLLLPVTGAGAAFLTVNWPPARIFMGDVGSLPVGFLLAAGAVVGNERAGLPFVSSFLILGPFLFDTLLTLVRRAVRRENVLAPHRSHLYQRMTIAGRSHRFVTLVYGAWTVLTGGLGLLYLSGGTVARAASLGAALLSGLGIWGCVAYLEGRQGKG